MQQQKINNKKEKKEKEKKGQIKVHSWGPSTWSNK